MYESFFGLRERPFPSAPVVNNYFPGESTQHARKQLERCIERGEGTGLIVGAAGTGKTMLLQVLATHFREKFHVALLAGTSLCTRRALLQSILFELKLPYRGMEEGELRLSLIDHLRPSRECPHGMLLLIDEAHTLPLRLLEEIRLITNLVQDGIPRVRVVLAGSLSLEERFTSPKLASFSQRIAARCYLHPLNRMETGNYVRHHLERAGARAGSIISDDAARAIHVATDGIPRLINQVCDHALMLAAAGGKRLIDAAGVQEAWADLQQLPTPWTEPAAPLSAAIEFGALSDGDEEVSLAGLGSSVLSNLDNIDLKLAELEELDMSGNRLGDDFHPLRQLPEIELSFTNKEQLFGAAFDEEEIVIDRYAALDASVLRSRPQVSTTEGIAFTEEVSLALPERPNLKLVDIPDCSLETDTEPTPKTKAGPLARQVAKAKKKLNSPVVAAAPVAAEAAPVILAAEEFPAEELPEFDPVYPEETRSSSSLESKRGTTVAAKQAAPEKTEQARTVPLTAPVRPHRPEFRQLFANLRGVK